VVLACLGENQVELPEVCDRTGGLDKTTCLCTFVFLLRIIALFKASRLMQPLSAPKVRQDFNPDATTGQSALQLVKKVELGMQVAVPFRGNQEYAPSRRVLAH
jgi:hypothetical protein